MAGADIARAGDKLVQGDVVRIGEEVAEAVDAFLVAADVFADKGVANFGASMELVVNAALFGELGQAISDHGCGETGEHHKNQS